MMSEMGKKRNIKIFSAVIAAIFVFSVAGLAIMQTGNPVNAAPSSNIGVVDTSKIITPDNQDAVAAQKQLQQAGEDMQKQFEQQSAGMDDQQKQQLFQKILILVIILGYIMWKESQEKKHCFHLRKFLQKMY